jgi:DNA polymerase III subunit gamma/tau
MGQALYRKYRSKSLSDVVGQDHITKTLGNALKSGKISHAYLFTGPRGVGKTSVARILAHEVNNLAYNDESIHLDIIEIDAASNRRIDEIRDLRDKVRIAPTSSKYKVYIIDEVHMLTREAFNALLKTLEEPPAHCIFILATTEAHKLPETIISRTQRFEFKPIASHQAADHLAQIAKQEKITIDKPALDLLAQYGNGSFRDSISYLDQLSSYGDKITQQDVRRLLGLPEAGEAQALLDSLSKANSASTLEKLSTIQQKGVNAPAIAAELSKLLRGQAVNSQIERWQIQLLRDLLEVSASHRPMEALEIALLNASSHPDRPQTDTKPLRPAALLEIEATDSIEQPVRPKEKTPSPKTQPFDLSLWDSVVDKSKHQAASIYTALRLAKPSYSQDVLLLSFQFPLHQKKLNLAKNKELVSQIILEICGSKVKIETTVDKFSQPVEIDQDKTPATVGAISNIFGGAEVLEA